jgi:hypothetical protein
MASRDRRERDKIGHKWNVGAPAEAKAHDDVPRRPAQPKGGKFTRTLADRVRGIQPHHRSSSDRFVRWARIRPSFGLAKLPALGTGRDVPTRRIRSESELGSQHFWIVSRLSERPAKAQARGRSGRLLSRSRHRRGFRLSGRLMRLQRRRVPDRVAAGILDDSSSHSRNHRVRVTVVANVLRVRTGTSAAPGGYGMSQEILLSGFIGAVAGSVLALVGAVFLQWWDRRQTRRGAARAVLVEILGNAQSLAFLASGEPHWELSVAAWTEMQDRVALFLRAKELHHVAIAYWLFGEAITRERALSKRRKAPTPDELAWFAGNRARYARAIGLLKGSFSQREWTEWKREFPSAIA